MSIWGCVEDRDGKVSDMDKPNWLEWDSEQDRMHGNLELINQMSISEFCLHIMSLFWRRWGLTSSTSVCADVVYFLKAKSAFMLMLVFIQFTPFLTTFFSFRNSAPDVCVGFPNEVLQVKANLYFDGWTQFVSDYIM